MLQALASLTPVYLLANTHCLGMCGPLAFLIARHPRRWLYFLGRISGFAVMGGLAALFGEFLSETSLLPFINSLLFGACLLLLGLYGLGIGKTLSWGPLTYWFSTLSTALARLVHRATSPTLFLLGAATLLLPCGQSLMVLALSALMESVTAGICNGVLFALLTSPSLWIAMRTHNWIKERQKVQKGLAWITLGIGVVLVLRGMAQQGWIDHLGWKIGNSHFVVY